MKKSTKELADELDAQDRLKARGYVKEPCPACKGLGSMIRGGQLTLDECFMCHGVGFTWQAPLTR